MTCCNEPCKKLNHVSSCIDEENPLLIGTIEELEEPVVVFALNLATGIIYQYPATSNALGVVEISEDVRFVSLAPILFFIRLQSDLQGDNVTIDNDFNCIEYVFGRVT